LYCTLDRKQRMLFQGVQGSWPNQLPTRLASGKKNQAMPGWLILVRSHRPFSNAKRSIVEHPRRERHCTFPQKADVSIASVVCCRDRSTAPENGRNEMPSSRVLLIA
jgi:hypothetical protein